jgi:hypothetical protein
MHLKSGCINKIGKFIYFLHLSMPNVIAYQQTTELFKYLNANRDWKFFWMGKS